ncbi:MAG: c-type cytochrome, partial [Planctomycetaceae bacterium]|nr:c-type cytochrome [Planctomycetaceae bacterium]
MGGTKGVNLEAVQGKLVTQFQTMMGSQRPRDEIADATMRETARLLCSMDVADATPLLVQTMNASKELEAGLHYALCLRYMKSGWDFHSRLQVLNWYETTRDWEGGNSLQGYVRNVVAGICEGLSPDDRKEMLTQWQQRPHATRLLLSISTPDNVKDFDQVVGNLLGDMEKMPGHASLQEMVSLTIEALGKSDSDASRATLRKLFDTYPDRREQLARQLCNHPDEDCWPQLVKALSFGDGTTMQQCLKALTAVDRKPEAADDFRAAILAGLKLNDQGGMLAADLLQIWTGAEHHAGKDLNRAIAFYQGWFQGRFPQAAPAVLPQIDIEKTRYGLDQLVKFLDQDPKGQAGDPVKGKAIFTKANCIKCHRFNNEGEGIGPDLTTVRRRFQRKEIVESLLTPSQVISDQYKSVTVFTKAGLVHSGMPVPNTGNNDAVVLLLSDATRITIPKSEIEELVPAKVSVMPEGLLKELNLDDIADLFAFIETSKQNEEPAQRAAK